MKYPAAFTVLLFLGGCGTYFSPTDEYMRGLRWFDRAAYKQAYISWEGLARTGDCDAQFRLGTMYSLGAHVEPNDETAIGWLTAAANQGQAFAQSLLATAHAHGSSAFGTFVREVEFDCTPGCGAVKDSVEAYKWAVLSEKFSVYDGHRNGIRKMLAEYDRTMAPAQIAEGKRRALDWKPSPHQCKQRKIL